MRLTFLPYTTESLYSLIIILKSHSKPHSILQSAIIIIQERFQTYTENENSKCTCGYIQTVRLTTWHFRPREVDLKRLVQQQ